MHRALAVLALVVAALSTAANPSRAAPAPELLGGDAALAARVPVVGASPAELRVTRQALRGVAGSLPLRRVTFGHQGTRRSVALALGVRTRAPGVVGTRRYWLGRLALAEIASRQQLLGHDPVAWTELRPDGDGSSWRRDGWPGRGVPALLALARRIGERAEREGLAVQRLRAWALGPGAVELALRLTERQFLDGRTDWSTLLLADRSKPNGYSALLMVEAPDGTPVHWSGNVRRSSGFAAYGALGAPRGHASPPPDLHGPTLLQLTYTPVGASGQEPPRRFVLDCDGGRSSGLADPGAVCRRLVSDRYALLAPVVSDSSCSGVPADTLDIRGTVFGVAVERGYSNCYGDTTVRWRSLLHVDSASARARAGGGEFTHSER